MKRFRIIYCLVALAVVASCNKIEENNSVTPDADGIFSASFEKGPKVTLGDDYYYRWAAGDLVSVFTEDHSNRQYKATVGDVVETELEYVSTTATSTEALTDYNYAVFPYNAANSVNSGVVYSTIAYNQTYGPKDITNAIMTSRIPASEENFVFKNSCALLKINLKIAEAFAGLHSVNSITVTSKSKKLSGPVSVNVAEGDYTAKIDESSANSAYSVVLNGCENAGLLKADEYITFYLAIPAGTYAAEDLTVTILTKSEGTPLNLTSVVPDAYTVGRSHYIELSSTVAKSIQWFEQRREEIIIKEDVVLLDKAIMTYSANLIKQGFRDQDKIETIFDVPSGDVTITGEDLVNGGYAQTAENGPTITFKKSAVDHVMNTFTTTNSGIKGVTPNKVTVKALTITGELRTSTMGIYVHDKNANVTGGSTDQSAFNTEWINVNVVDCVVPLYTVDFGGAVCVYGTALVDGCKIKGTKPAASVPADQYDDIYDICITNNAKITFNNSEVGRMLTWEHHSTVIQNGSLVDYINYRSNAVNSASGLTIDNSVVTTVDGTMGTIAAYGTRITLKNNAQVGTLLLPVRTSTSTTKYLYSISIEDGCTIDKVVVGAEEMTLEQFKEKYPSYLK